MGPPAVREDEEEAMKVQEIEGVGPAYATKLEAAGVDTVEGLLAAGGSRSGREKLAETTGIDAKLLLEWVNHADLMRIPGVGSEYSDLLEAAGVDSPAELAQRNAANLAETFAELDAARPNVVRRVPSAKLVEGWIELAKGLPKVVEH
jgi:predicted flap endonuclease-1-like 5' DNA nuclease